MPRPSLRRTVSTPIVRARATSNPYPPPSYLSSSSSSSSYQSMSIFSSAARSSSSNSVSHPVSRRMVSSSSASNSIEDSEYSHPISTLDEPDSPSNGRSQTQSRRVLADITWWFDGQLCSMEDPVGFDGDLDAPFILAESDSGTLESAFSMDTSVH
jgi:hypothetical protein